MIFPAWWRRNSVEFTDLIASSSSIEKGGGGGITALNTQRKQAYLRLGAINKLQFQEL